MPIPELKPFWHEAEFTFELPPEGNAKPQTFTLRMVVNFRSIDRLEGLTGKGMDEILGELSSSVGAATKVLWGFTREHHQDLTFDQIAGLMFDDEARREGLMATLGDLVRRAFHIGEQQEGEQSRPPLKSSRGARRASSKNGSLRGSGRVTSGSKARARS